METKASGRWLMAAVLALNLATLGVVDTPAAYGQSRSAPQSIKLGAVISLTGPMTAGGKWVTQGYNIAVKHMNETGGVLIKEFGRKIPLEIVYLDNESDPKQVATRMERLYSIDKVDVFLGGFTQFLIVPQLAVAEKYRVPIIATTLSSTAEFEKGYRYSFTPFVSDREQVQTFFEVLDALPASQRPTGIAFFEIQEEWGVATGRYLRESGPQRGYKIVTQEKHSMTTTDFSSLVIAAKSAGAEALYATPTPPQGIALIKQMKELDWAPKFPVILRAADVNFWAQNLGKDGDYVFHNGGGWDYHLKLPGVDRLNADYRAAYGVYPEQIAGTAYAVVQILADALQRAGTLDREKIRDAIAATNLATVMGQIRFKPNGRAEGYVRAFSQWQNGKDELIWPREHASAQMIYPVPPWNKR